MKNLKKKDLPSESMFQLKKKLINGGNVIDDNFRKIAVENHLEGVTKLVGGANWEKATNKVIVDNLVEKIEQLLNAKVIRQTVVNSRGEVKQRIIIEHD